MKFSAKCFALPGVILLFSMSSCVREESTPEENFPEESDWGEIGWEDDEEMEMPAIDRGKRLATFEEIPSPPREFRAAWVATVHNLDWPSKPGLPVREMEAEAIAILDRLLALNMNAVIFQVRPDADAFYASDLEPWSYYLTGKQGVNETGFDPLQFWVKEAHSRGIQLHAWFNPYRAYHHSNHGTLSDRSIIKSHPELVVKLKREGYWWMDPGSPEAREHTLKVVMDVVSRYDIDGVHFDDYFYPYPAYNNNRSFPDSDSYSAYRKCGGDLGIGDWRRDSVNQLVHELSNQIKTAKRHVEFGISPFGIWKPGYPEGTTGLDQYNVLYADARLWFKEGWVDYLMPQLYWPIDSKKQSFSALLNWWDDQNQHGRHLWPGMKISQSDEMVDQIGVVRDLKGSNSGMCLFSMKRLMRDDKDTASTLKKGPWTERALIPPSPWITAGLPLVPEVTLARDASGSLVVRTEAGIHDFFHLIINEKRMGVWQPPRIGPGTVRRYRVEPGVEAIAVRGVDRLRNMSDPTVVEVRQEITSL